MTPAGKSPGSRRISALILGLLLIFSSRPGRAGLTDAARKANPRDVGLTERSATQLVQLDVSVAGPPGKIIELGKGDFEVRVNGQYLQDFFVDRVCRGVQGPLEAQDSPAVQDSTIAEKPAVTGTDEAAIATPITYVFYFDNTHLTMQGYHRSFQIAEEMFDSLLGPGTRAMIVSSGRKLRVVTELTADAELLRAGLADLKRDRRQFDTFAMEEDLRIDQVLRSNSLAGMVAMARSKQQEELWAASRSLQRLSMSLGRIAEVDPPKAFFYFADTMRRNPGEHLRTLFGSRSGGNAMDGSLGTYAFMAKDAFDRVINEASALGIRFYPIEAQGLTGLSITDSGRKANSRQRRVRDAQDTLATMALETGGRAFVNGVAEEKIIQQVRDDLQCMYLISFRPEGFPLDRPLPVRINTTREGTRAQARGRLVIQSESANRVTRLMAAFAAGHTEGNSSSISARIVPTGFVDGRYTSLVQIAVPGSQIPDTAWDLGLSVVSRGKVRDDASTRIRPERPGLPMVLEKTVEFRPGPYELVAVAHETTTDQVFSARLEGIWPDPEDERVTLLPGTMMQPVKAAFVRGSTLKDEGALAFGDDNALSTDRPIAVLGLVCRAKRNKATLRVERSLVGDSTAEFEPIEMENTGDRCGLYRDMIPAGTLGAGGFLHQVRVTSDEAEFAGTTEFQVLAADPVPSP